MSDATIASALKRRHEAKKAERLPHEAEWADCYRYTYPERGAGIQGRDSDSVNASAKGARAEIYDDTAKDSARILASSFASGLTPANSQWFGLETGSAETDEESRWLSDASQFLFDNIHNGNFDAAAFECHLDMAGGPGMFVLYTEEAKEGGYRFEQWPFGQCCVGSSESGGRVDTIFREFQMTVEQIVAAYGLNNVSEPTATKFRQNHLDEKIDVLWAIYPRASTDGAANDGTYRLAKNKAFASCHIELGQNKVLRESGYDEFPCCVPRWMLIPGTPYATGPMSSVLATVKTLNELKKLELVNLEFAAYGMYKATDDGVLNPHVTTIGPRRVVVVADMKNFEAMTSAGDFKVSVLKADELQKDIRKLMLADQLQPQDGPAMTATEVHARIMLIRQQLGPIFGRLQAEWLRPLIERCFGIALRAGALVAACGPVPESLRDKTLSVKYQSPLARAQKLEEVTAIDTWVAGILQYVSVTQDTSQLDEVNTTEINKFKRDALGVPSLAQRTPDEVAKIRAERAAAAKRAAQEAQQQQTLATAGDAMAERVAKAA